MNAATWDLDNVVPIRGYDKDQLKRDIPLEWVLYRFGVEMFPDSTGTRLLGNCPFVPHSEPKFTVRVTETGEQVAGCWACTDKAQGDLFELIRWLDPGAGRLGFGQVLTRAGQMMELFRADTDWNSRPARKLVRAPKADPGRLTADALTSYNAAIADPSLVKELIERKAETDPGWRRLTAEFLITQWLVGVEPARTVHRSVSNPDSAPYQVYTQTIDGTRVVVPHFSWSADVGQWLVRGMKTRAAEGGHLIAYPGSDLKVALYGAWRFRGHPIVLLAESESDAWAASATELSDRMDIGALPHGAGTVPSEELVAALRGRVVILAFDADDSGRMATGRWVTALDGVAQDVLIVGLAEGDDLGACPDIVSAVSGAASAHAGSDGSDGAAAVGIAAAATVHADDIANAELFVQQHRHHLRWHPTEKLWLAYDGTRWVHDHGGAAVRAATETSRSLYSLRLDLLGSGGLTEDALKVLTERVKAAGDKRRITAMMEIGKAFMEVKPGDVDSDPWVLNCLNGTLDLRTGTLREHSPDDLLTQMAPVHFDPAARSERWEYFLASTIPDADERAFLQRMAGYFLTGTVPEEKFFILQGAAGAGKGTFTEAITAAMGSYATSADVELFLKSQRPRGAAEANPAMASLVGRRLVVSQEPPKGRSWDEGLIKRLTGGDTVTTRQLHGRTFEFKPTFTMLVQANLRTSADGNAGGGLSRRLVEVPFPVVAGGGTRDDSLKVELCDVEKSGAAILSWMVAGCLAWQRDGLAVPKAVMDATVDYWEEQIEGDPVVGFIADYYDVTGVETDRVRRSKLFEHFQEVTHSRWQRRAFLERLKDASSVLGVWEAKLDGYDVYSGLKLKEAPTWDLFINNSIT